MSRFDRLFQAELARRAAQGLRRELRLPAGTLDMCSNDYLGLARHPALAERAAQWGARYGTGARASRLVSGTCPAHLAVERKVAALKGTEAALVLASGWQANAAVLAALLRLMEGATVLADALVHNSLHAGCRLGGVRPVLFRHNDLEHLETLLRGAPAGPRLIVTESVFSMDGDRADLAALAALAAAHDAFFYVDEAHATGVLGPGGRGLSAGVDGIDLVMGTFSKALGGFGAFVAGSRALIDYLVNGCAGFVYTTGVPPPMLGAADAALDLLPSLEHARARVARAAVRLRRGLQALGIDTAGSTTQIVPAIMGQERAALALSAALAADGIDLVAIRPPTVPPGTARLRIAVSASHRETDIDRVLARVAESWPHISRAA